MALIAMAVYDTEENGRTWMTEATLQSLMDTVDLEKHRLVVVDNGSCDATQDMYLKFIDPELFTLIQMNRNVGTAVAINAAWKLRKDGEACIKMDNDVVIHNPGWVDLMEEAFGRDDKLGILGLKRKDLEECPWSPVPWYRSALRMLPHAPGMRWIIVEDVNHVMGTCQAYSPALLRKIGYLYQMQDEGNLYGFDDSLASARSQKAGFINSFLHGVEIDHIDNGTSKFSGWKRDNAGKWIDRYLRVKQEYLDGTRLLYWEDK
jgi:glycosyltransferase involved in cell wall biosynthesis